MKNKVQIIIIAILVVLGITGGVVINKLYYNKNNQDGFSRGQVAKMLLLVDYTKEELEQEQCSIEAKDNNPDSNYYLYMSQAVNKKIMSLNKDNFDEEKLLTYKMAGEIINNQGIDEALIPFTMHDINKIISKEEWLIIYDLIIDSRNGNSLISNKDLLINSYGSEEDKNIVNTNEGDYLEYTQKLDEYINTIINVYVNENEIIAYGGECKVGIVLHNTWIEKVSKNKITLFIEGEHKEYDCFISNTEGLESNVADATLNNQGITNLAVKNDVIAAKVLSINSEGIEIEGYGILPRSQFYNIYKIYGELSYEKTSSILIGYSTTKFVVADGVIEAALIVEPIKAQNIRVVINNSDYSSLIHDKVTITSQSPYTVSYGDITKEYEPGEEITLDTTSEEMKSGRVKISTQGENDKITISSITRAYGTPQYRGSIEIALYEQGLIIINELPIEEYLYSVVPSEMPTSYGVEALKVQAICARGFAYAMIINNYYAKYGAHLDDSTSTQVYNNSDENEDTIFAVKDTYGEAPFYEGEPITAFFFSTSCGVTCDNQEVWYEDEVYPYLVSNMETPSEEPAELSDETKFRNFIDTGSGYDTFENEFPLYRWSVNLSVEELSDAINSTLESRIAAKSEYILKEDSNGEFVPCDLSSIGQILGIKVTQRGDSGIVKEITITGEKGTIKVMGQTNARALITPKNVLINKNDKTTLSDWSMLPSAFYYIQENIENDKLTGVVLLGGGFGHGVGMSQNGAKAMTQRGYQAEEIIAHYYRGTQIVNIYQ